MRGGGLGIVREDTPLKREKEKGNFRKKEKRTLNMGMTRMG